MNLPIFYLGLALDNNAAEALLVSRSESLSIEVEQGRLSIPGVKVEATMPEECGQYDTHAHRCKSIAWPDRFTDGLCGQIRLSWGR